jgi:hypothetical protein
VSNFARIVVCDFEYEVAPGELPDVLCMVAQVLDENFRHLQTIKLWRGGFGAEPPFDIGPDTLFVAYSAWAEMTCFKVLGWKFPEHIFDQHTAYLASTNILEPYEPDEVRKREPKRLPDACRAYGIEGWDRIDKDDIAPAIGNGTWRGRYSPEEILTYCAEDVRMELLLLRAQILGGKQFAPADVDHVLHWSNYSAKCIALIQARGMPIDTRLWSLVQENKPAVISELCRRFDPSHNDDEPIYDVEGSWSYQRFEQWLARAGVAAWPRLSSGRLDTDDKIFRLMSDVPGVEGLSALRKSLSLIVKANCRSGVMAETVHRYSHLGPRPAATRIASRSTTHTRACAHSWCFRRKLSAPIWTGARKRSELPRRYPATRRSLPTITPATSITP